MTHAVGERAPSALFLNQGVIGGGAMMGHLATEHALRLGVSTRPDVDAHFVQLPQWSPAMRTLAHRLPGVSRWNLDLHVSRWHLAESYRARRVVAQWMRTMTPDVLHVDSHTAAFGLTHLMATTRTFLAVDVPVREHETVLGPRQFGLAPSLAVERRAFQRAEGVLAYHEWSAQAVRRACPEANVRVLHPGVDTTKYLPLRRPPNTERRVVFVGGDFHAKGGDDLLEALQPHLGRGVVLDVVTSSAVPPRPGLRVHHLGVGDPRLVELYQQADLMCLPSHRDVGPWAILEALACGTPVIGSTVGAIPELLNNSGAGLCVDPRHPTQLRLAIDSVLFDEARLTTMAAGGLQMITDEFDARRQGRKLMELMVGPP